MKSTIGVLSIGLLFVFMARLGGQTVETHRAMRDKLTHGQRVLEALTTSDYRLLQRESDALVKVTESQAWSVLNGPEFRQFSTDFRDAARKLAKAADERDLDAAAVEYTAVVTSCYACHRHVKGKRIAR